MPKSPDPAGPLPFASPRGEHFLRLRVIVENPPPDVLFGLQKGSSEIVSAVRSSGANLNFEFEVRARPDPDGSTLRLLGPFTQGPPSVRFVYINSGTYAGEAGSCWSRRAKIPIGGITPELMEQMMATPGAVLEARIAGKSKDGGPVCASVKLVEPGWAIASGEPTRQE